MKFGQSRFEYGAGARESSRELERAEKIAEAVGNAVAEDSEKGIPLHEVTGRIDMGAPEFLALHSRHEVETDIARVSNLEKRMGRAPELDVSVREFGERLCENTGEQLEALTLLLFRKFLGEEYIVARTSPYDDYVGGVDMFLLHRKTGEVVCAIDEVGAITGDDIQKKKEQVEDVNVLETGAFLKYGLTIGQNGEVLPAAIEHVPKFYLPLPPEEIRGLRNHMNYSSGEPSKHERNTFQFFCNMLLEEEIPRLETLLNRKILSISASSNAERFQGLRRVQERIRHFKQILSRVQEEEFGILEKAA